MGFDVSKKNGGDGREIEPDENSFHDGKLTEINGFEIEVKVRSTQHENIFQEGLGWGR
jgi:hypothetical protein